MKKRTILVLCLLAVLSWAVYHSPLKTQILPLVQPIWHELKALLPRAAEPDKLQIQNHFMVRDKNDSLIPESDTHLDAAAYPDSFDWLPTVPAVLDGHTYLLWDERVLQGAMDKFLVVRNEGNVPVYFRTCIALPVQDLTAYVVFNRNTQDYLWTDQLPITLDGQPYTMYVATSKSALAPGCSAPASLLQTALRKNTPLEQVVPFNIQLTTLVVSAVGFDGLSAAEVLDQTHPLNSHFNPFQ